MAWSYRFQEYLYLTTIKTLWQHIAINNLPEYSDFTANFQNHPSSRWHSKVQKLLQIFPSCSFFQTNFLHQHHVALGLWLHLLRALALRIICLLREVALFLTLTGCFENIILAEGKSTQSETGKTNNPVVIARVAIPLTQNAKVALKLLALLQRFRLLTATTIQLRKALASRFSLLTLLSTHSERIMWGWKVAFSIDGIQLSLEEIYCAKVYDFSISAFQSQSRY